MWPRELEKRKIEYKSWNWTVKELVEATKRRVDEEFGKKLI